MTKNSHKNKHKIYNTGVADLRKKRCILNMANRKNTTNQVL